jgi:hypothetical protein
LPGTAFLFHFSWNIFMKSYAGNWQINCNSRNQMSEKILSERIPLNGQWNNRTTPTWPETRHGCEGRSRTSYFLTKLAKSNDKAIPDNRSWNPRVFIGPAVILPDLSDSISFSLNQCLSPLKLLVQIPAQARCTQYNII